MTRTIAGLMLAGVLLAGCTDGPARLAGDLLKGDVLSVEAGEEDGSVSLRLRVRPEEGTFRSDVDEAIVLVPEGTTVSCRGGAVLAAGNVTGTGVEVQVSNGETLAGTPPRVRAESVVADCPGTVGETPTVGDESDCQPWTECPEASWLAERLEAAGFRVAGDTGSALVATGKGATFHASMTDGSEPLQDEGYELVGEVDGAEVLGDGIRLTWTTERGRVWISPGGGGVDPDPRRSDEVTLDQIRRFVRVTSGNRTR